MAGLEVVVRPVVLPNIRPRPAQSLPPADDPDKGFCTIHGNPAKHIDLSNSHSSSMSKSHNVETERRVDVARVYQEEDDGTINRDNFVDIEIANRIKMRGGKKPTVDGGGPTSTEGAGSGTPGTGSADTYEQRVDYYRKIEEAIAAEAKKNIEIKKKDEIQKARDPGQASGSPVE